MEAIRQAQRVDDLTSQAIAALFTRQITGTPAALAQTANGFVTLALAAAVEVQAHRLILLPNPYRLQDLVSINFEIACSANLPANTEVAFGLARTINDDPDLIDEGVWFKILDDNTVVGESDDNAGNDIDDVPLNVSAGVAFRNYSINFRDGVWLGDPRGGGSVGGRGKIELQVETAQGLLRTVAGGTQFRLDNAVGPVTPFIQITKAAANTLGAVYVRHITVRRRIPSFNAV
jgi:hypothetical protein